VSEAFAEDPLRVLRGFQFAARFGLEPAAETLSLCRSVQADFGELPLDRVRREWLKWAGQSNVPSCGLRFLVAAGWVGHFPEIQALIDVPQDPIWHPEGDVFTHTCHCCDALVQLPGWQSADPETRSVLLLAILAHDFAKPETTHEAIRDGRPRIVAPGHEKAGGPLADRFLQRLGVSKEIQARVIPLVTHHLAHNQPLTDRAVRRLARRLAPESIENLCLIITADQFGRPPKPRVPPPGLLELQSKAAELKVETKSPTPILKGQHLIEIGLEPGIWFKEILDRAFDRQIEGEFEHLSAAFRWLSQQTEVSLSDVGRLAAHARHLETLPVEAGRNVCNQSLP
jgi:tRNA nucleotidyltransferase (CCA-adding enzyme)